MAKEIPRVALKLTVIMYGGIGVFILWLAASSNFEPALIGLLIMYALISIGMVRPMSTVLSSEGVSQLGINGRQFLAWDEVKEAKLEYQSFTVASSQLKLSLPLILFSHTDAAVEYVANHIPEHVRKGIS